jgi:hypothetical protein
MTKKIGKGQEITELVKGSLEYTLEWISAQFRKQFPYLEGGPNYWVADSFADYVAVGSYGDTSGLMPNEYFKVAYTKSGDEYTFAARDQWEVVELGYQPKSMISESKKKNGRKFEEAIAPGQIELLEAKDEKKGTRRIRINELVVANVVNGNKRLYDPGIVEAMIADWQSHLHESAGQGRLKILTGEADHPTDKGRKRTEFLETVVRWDKLDWDGKQLDIEGDLILTSKGRDVEILMEAGVRPGGSIRGMGESKIEKINGQKVERVLWLSMNGVDLVGDPSFKNSAELQESITQQGDEEMLEELKKLLAEHPELFSKGMTEAELEKMGEKQLKKLEESLRNTLGLGADANIIEAVKSNADKAKQFDELQAKQAVDAAITEATKDLPFGKDLNEAYTESITDGNFGSPDAVKAFAESQRKLFNKLASNRKLRQDGFTGVTGVTGVQMIGGVLENETGTPEYARVAFELSESVRKHEKRSKRTLVLRAESPAAVFTEMLLEKFDKQFQRQLIAEAKEFEEAETTADLNLPYSVSRTVIAEAYPNLVAANIFDFGIMDQSPMNIFYETFTGETGFTVAITDEVNDMGAEDTWYDLAHKNIVPGTVVVTSNPAGTNYVEGTDYVIDYELGKIRAIAAGAIDANDVLVDYSYHATRKGENAEIERAKTTLAFEVITAAADRLADYITHEAIVFSRSQIGWDAVGRTMANIIRELRRDKDRRLLEKALAAALSVANNKTAAWDVSDAVYLDLVKRIGEAKVKVVNRFYIPTSLVMSATNSDYLSNWDGFTRDGFTNAELNAAGFVGRVKGLNVWETPEMRDTFNLVTNSELVMHRVFSPMTIKGPFPTYSNGKLVAAEQYYAEEYNASLAPIGGKGSVVPTQP